MPCPGPFHFSHSVDYIYELCPLPDPDVGPSICVCDVEHTSFLVGYIPTIRVYTYKYVIGLFMVRVEILSFL